MVSTHTHSFQHDNRYSPPAPPPSAVTFQMPDVVVYPPEEEQYETPPYLCFNAAEAYADDEDDGFESPDIATIQSRLDIWQRTIGSDAPIFHRGYVGVADVPMPRRGSFHHNRPSAALDIFNEAFDSSKRHKEEEDVIEVVKVPRGATMQDVRTAPKKGKSFKARATLALRSMRVVKKPPPKQPVLPAKENTDFEADAERKRKRQQEQEEGTMGLRRLKTTKSTRRLSRPLSQLFGKVAPVDVPESVSPTTESHPTLSSATSSDTRASFESRTSIGVASSHTLHTYLDDTARSVSPSPSSKGARHRFSFVNLQSLFTAPTPAAASPSTTSDSLPSTVEPTTPIDDSYEFPSQFSLGIGSGDSDGLDVAMEDQSHKSGSMDSAAEAARDISFEMRLDSLHFDSLSFDVDGFDITR